MNGHDDTHGLDELLRSADPWPVSRPVDPAIAEAAISHLEKELRMTDMPSPRPLLRRRRPLIAALALVALALSAGVAVVALDDGDPAAPQSAGRPIGSAAASCLPFTLENLALAPVAFDGTVTDIAADGAVTFSVERWFRGGSGDRAVTRDSGLVGGAPQLEGGVGFEQGGRYLVSGDRKGDAVTPAICGFTLEWTSSMADDWARAFAG